MKLPILFLTLLAISATSSVFANEKANFGEVGIAGNGCPEETDSISPSLVKFDADSVRVIPTQFVLSNKLSKKTLIRKKCDMALAVEVPDGYQVGISNSSMQSFLALDDDSKSSIRLEAGFTGSEFTVEESKTDSMAHQSVELSNKTTQWADCGADTIIRMKVSATLKADEAQFSYLRVNSFGLGIEYRACRK